MEAENYLRRLANETGYAQEILARQVGAIEPRNEFAPRQPRLGQEEIKASREEGMLIAMLAKGLIPPQSVSPDDFDSPINAGAARWLMEEKPITAYVDGLEEKDRAQMMADINSDFMPDDQAMALDMARDMLRAIRKRRIQKRIDEIKAELGSADDTRKQELLAQLTKLIGELRG